MKQLYLGSIESAFNILFGHLLMLKNEFYFMTSIIERVLKSLKNMKLCNLPFTSPLVPYLSADFVKKKNV